MRLRLGALVVAVASCSHHRVSREASTSPSSQASSQPPSAALAVAPVDARWQPVAPGITLRTFDAPLDDVDLSWAIVRFDVTVAVPGLTPSGHENLDDVLVDPGVTVAVNGAYFDDAHHPTGWLVSQGQALAPWQPGGGSGLLWVHDAHAEVVPSTPAPAAGQGSLVVQCGPRLVEADGSVGIHRDDGRRYARTAVCVRDHGRTLDFVATWDRATPLRGPGLFGLAQWLVAAGCESALNLDGGPSTAVYARAGTPVRHAPIGPVPWWIIAR